MINVVLWFVVVLAGALSVWAVTAGLGRFVVTPQHPAWVARSVALVAAAVGGIAAIAELWRIREVAEADGRIVARLSLVHSAALTTIFSFVTTAGDAIPTFTLAAVLALLIARRTSHHVLAWILPVVVVVEVVIQDAMTKYVHDFTIAMVDPAIPIGGRGSIPSGSMARLLSVFMVAALLWRASNPAAVRTLTAVGGTAVLVEMISRLYLARHLLGDMAAGLLLGICLTTAAAWLISIVDYVSRRVRLDPMGVATPPAREPVAAVRG